MPQIKIFLLVLGGFIFSLPIQAKPNVPDALKDLTRQYGQARDMRDWVATAPHLSQLERQVLLAEPKFLSGALPKVSFRSEKNGSTYLSVNGIEFEFTNVDKGEISYRGRAVRVHRNLNVLEFAGRLQKLIGKSEKTMRLELFPSAFAEGIASGCATKDLFTLYDIFNSPFGFVPHIWISAAAVSVQRWADDQFRNCDRQIGDLRELLKTGGLAVKNLDCGKDFWGAGRKIEFWIPERLAKRSRARSTRSSMFLEQTS
jgi:hypothetical protein